MTPRKTDDPALPEVTECLRAYILANDAARKHPHAYRSFHNPHTPEGAEYERLSQASQKAASDLWMATDFEYDDSAFRSAVWTWRYWKVMARKCCWYQLGGKCHWRAGWTMGKLQEAETKMVEVCGLTGIYRTACSYLEEAFPNLKNQASKEG